MLWTVIIPTKGPAPYLQQALESVQSQLTDGEILVRVNPDPGNRLDHLYHPRTEFESNQWDRGCYGSVNDAIKQARGEFIHVLHDDDWVTPRFYREMAQPGLVAKNVGLFTCTYRNFDQMTGDCSSPFSHLCPGPGIKEMGDQLSRQFTRGNPFQVPAVVFHKDVFRDVGLFREDMPYAADWEFYARVLTKFDWVPNLTDMARYRVHDGQRAWAMIKDGRAQRDCAKARSLATEYFHRRTDRAAPPAVPTLGRQAD